MNPTDITANAGRKSDVPLVDGHPERELIRNADGARVSDLRMVGSLWVQSPGVTVRDCVMDYREGVMPWDVFLFAADNVTVENCTVYGAVKPKDGESRVVRYAGDPKNAVFRRNHMVGINSDGVKAVCGPGAVVAENWFDGFWHYPDGAVAWDQNAAYPAGTVVYANGSAMQRAGGAAREEGVFQSIENVLPGHTRPSQSAAWKLLGSLAHGDLVQTCNEHDFSFRDNLIDLRGPGGLNRVAIIAKGEDKPVGIQTYTGNIMRDMGGAKPVTCFDIDLPHKGQGPVVIDGNTLIYSQWPLHPRRSLPENILWGTNYTPDGDVIPLPRGAVPLDAGGQPVPPVIDVPDERDAQIAALTADLDRVRKERDDAQAALSKARAAWVTLAAELAYRPDTPSG